MAKHLQQMDLFGSEPSEAVHIVAPKTSKASTILQKANLPKQTLNVVTENVLEEEAENFSSREAARAIVFANDNLVAMLHATKTFYYKLPGGGIEAGETNEMALRRECKEEIGCDVEIVKELGSTLEYRKKYKLKQTSYCYVAKIKGEKGIPALEKDEIVEGFETVWLPIEDALKKVIESKPTIYEGQYMNARDIALIERAIKILK
jgi:8-oxo-dGTP diphosphatase